MVKLQKVTAENNLILDAIRASYKKNSIEKNSPLKIKIALSGGCDSMVLLHALKQLQSEISMPLQAVYIDHGLSKKSQDWCDFCRKFCNDIEVPFQSKAINIENMSELGIEGAARELRYQALTSSDEGVVVTAHHENDQAETLILQLIRGAGLKGLASMPEFDDTKKIWRPFLKIQRKDIENYAAINDVHHIEDDSNHDTRFDRNFIRKEILPKVYKRFPYAAKTISRSASLIAEGLVLHQSIAEEDSKQYFSENLTRLNLLMMQDLSQERAINLIRWWLEKNEQKMPSLKIMQEIYKQIISIKKDAQINIHISHDTSIRAYKSQLRLVPITINKKDYEFFWRGEDEIILPDMSRLIFKKSKGSGISIKKLGTNTIRIQNRKGGERFKPVHNQPTRTLKYLLQKSQLPPWERDNLPMLFIEDHLVAVPNFGIDHEYYAQSTEDSFQINWLK